MRLNYLPIMVGIFGDLMEHVAYNKYGPPSEKYPNRLPYLLGIVERIHNCCHHLENEIRQKMKEVEE